MNKLERVKRARQEEEDTGREKSLGDKGTKETMQEAKMGKMSIKDS